MIKRLSENLAKVLNLRKATIFPALLCCFFFFINANAQTQLRLRSEAFSALAGNASSASNNALAAAGQAHPIGISSNNAHVLHAGFIPTLVAGASVWPGDTNNDGVINAADVLPIGLYWNLIGPARQNGSCNWVAQFATSWTPLAATYADANGDGVANQTDVLCIGLNWGRTHGASTALLANNPSSAALQSAKTATLYYKTFGNPAPGQEIWVEVFAQEVENLFGLAFELAYAPAASLTLQTTEAGPFMGNDILFYSNEEADAGKISIGATRKAGQGGVSGSGVVARFKMRIPEQMPAGQRINFTLQNISANDAAGNALTFLPDGTTAVEERQQTQVLPTAFALYPNAPNPFNPETMISYALPQAVEVKLQIFDVLGRHVRTLVEQHQQAGRYAIKWDGHNGRGEQLATGVFIYRLQAGNFAQSRKMVLAR